MPPPSPSDTNPPLGPAILATTAARAGYRVTVLDLNILLLQRFRTDKPAPGWTLGDHGKDRKGVAAAASWLFAATGLRDAVPLHLPDTADPVAGMHYSVETIGAAVDAATKHPQPWRAWLEEHLLTAADSPPVVGVSLMGPSQVFVGLLVLRLAKQIWPHTTTVLGGSHVTLLREQMRRDSRLRSVADLVLTGHCEDEFTSVVARHRLSRVHPALLPERPPGSPFEYLPTFSGSHLAHYHRPALTLPVQFSRGCSYGRCTFCTYPLVEPQTTAFAPAAARTTVDTLVREHGVRRFSLKDSLFTAPMLRAFAQELLRGPTTTIRWSATTKATRALIQLAPLLADAGLATLEIGVETIHPGGQRLVAKRAEPGMLQEIILALAEQGITVVTNLIFGLPGEHEEDAHAQLAWFLRLKATAPEGRVDCSLNMLEMVRGAPMTIQTPPGVHLRGVAPWAFSYAWDAPTWRPRFAGTLERVERSRDSTVPREANPAVSN